MQTPIACTTCQTSTHLPDDKGRCPACVNLKRRVPRMTPDKVARAVNVDDTYAEEERRIRRQLEGKR